MMTRKDYVSTAEILKNYALELGQGAFEDLVNDFAEMFEADNERFDSQKFFEACNKNNF
jgi:Ca2+-binding EF-hand superfamily protein